MRLTQEVTEYLVKEVAGEDTVKLVGLLKNQNKISEFVLAEKLKITVNNVRNMLYRLQEHNLVTSVRKKDKQKGWYIYYWTFNTPQARSLIITVKQRKLVQLRKRLERETQEMFYVCPEKCTRFKMENAMEYDFRCPECGTILGEEDNTLLIGKIKEKIEEIEQELTKPMVESRARTPTKIKAKGKTLAKKGKPKVTKKIKSKLVKRKVKLTKKKPKLKLKKLRTIRKTKGKKVKIIKKKLNLKKKSKITRKPKKPIKKAKKTSTKKIRKPKPKKKTILKRVKRFLKKKK